MPSLRTLIARGGGSNWCQLSGDVPLSADRPRTFRTGLCSVVRSRGLPCRARRHRDCRPAAHLSRLTVCGSPLPGGAFELWCGCCQALGRCARWSFLQRAVQQRARPCPCAVRALGGTRRN